MFNSMDGSSFHQQLHSPITLEEIVLQFTAGYMEHINVKCSDSAWNAEDAGRYLIFQVGNVPAIRVIPDIGDDEFKKTIPILAEAGKKGFLNFVLVISLLRYNAIEDGNTTGHIGVYTEAKDRGKKHVQIIPFERKKRCVSFKSARKLSSKSIKFDSLKGVFQ